MSARSPPTSILHPSHGSLGFRLHKLFLFDKASTISCSRGKRWWRMGARWSGAGSGFQVPSWGGVGVGFGDGARATRIPVPFTLTQPWLNR